jgi:hypothetical protein
MSSQDSIRAPIEINLSKDFKNTKNLPKTVINNGLLYEVITKESNFSLLERFGRIALGVLASVVSLGGALFFKDVRQLFLADKTTKIFGQIISSDGAKADASDAPKVLETADLKQQTANPLFEFIEFSATDWLHDDEHIIPYMYFIGKSHPELFTPRKGRSIHSPSGPQKDWFLEDVLNDVKKNPEKTIFAYPILVSTDHYTIAIVDKKTRTVEYFDPLYNYGWEDDNTVTDETLTSLAQKLDPNKPYTFSRTLQEKAIQKGSYQCGVWILFFLDERLKEKPLNFDQEAKSGRDTTEMIAEYRKVVRNALKTLTKEELKTDFTKKKSQEIDRPVSLEFLPLDQFSE